MTWQSVGNPFVIRLLRSPLHHLMGESTLLIMVTGRRSAKVYTVPVNYTRDGDDLLIVSRPEGTWWRNLRHGASVSIRMRGQEYVGLATVIEDGDQMIQSLLTVLRSAPQFQRASGVTLNADGEPEDPSALETLSQSWVVIRVSELSDASVVLNQQETSQV